MYYTFVNGNVADYWAKWQALVPTSGGIYEVFVHVPNVNATTWQARYVIRYNQNTLQTTALVDQAGLFNQWVSLGTYYMTNNDYVYTTDATGEFQGTHCGAGQYCRLGVDALKFVRRGTTYLPYATTSDWTSSVTVHNNGGGPAKVYLSIFDSNGSLQCSAFPVPDVPAHGNATFALTSTSCPQAASGRVDGSQNVAVVVENRNETWGYGYAYTGQTAQATTLRLPQTHQNLSGVWHTNIRALNIGPSPTNITTNFFNANGSTPSSGGTSTLPNVAVNGSGEVGQSSLPNGYWGAARMTANQPIAAVVRVSDSSAYRRLGYTGMPVAESNVWLPFVMTRLGNDWGATIWVQNTTGTDSTVSIDFYNEGGWAGSTGASTLLANSMALFNLRTNHYGLGWGWYGSARVTAGAPVAVVVNQLNDASILGASYEGIPASAGSTTVILPYVARQNGCYSSNFTVRNLGSSTATVTINYYRANGTLPVSVPNQSVVSHKLYNLHTAPPAGLPNPFIGSVVIISTNNQPIAATSNMLDYYCGANDTISYTGINR